MALSLTAILVSSALISLASAACRGVRTVQKVDLSMLKGVWYESHSFGLLPVAGPRLCPASHFYPAEDGKSFAILNDYVYYVGDQAQSARFGWNVTDQEPVKDGRFTVEMALHFSEWMKATLVVMDTDYINYAIIYVCRLVDNQYKFNGGMILTRRKLVDDEDYIHRKIVDSYKRNLMSKSEFIRTPQEDCKNVSFPEVFPAFVPIGKPATVESNQVNAVKPAERLVPPGPILTPAPADRADLLTHHASEGAKLNKPTNPDRLLSQIIYRLELKAGFFKGTSGQVVGSSAPSGGSSVAPGGSPPPTGGLGLPSGDSSSPSYGSDLPPNVGSNAPPYSSGLPSSGSSAPPGSSSLPSGSSSLPSYGSDLPSGGSSTSSYGTNLPSGGSSAPSYGSDLPAGGSSALSYGSNLPSGGSSAPSYGSNLPSGGPSAPSYGSDLPAGGSSASSYGSNLPSGGPSAPSYGSNLPSGGSSASSYSTGSSSATPLQATGKPPVQSTHIFSGRPFSSIIAELEAQAGLSSGLLGRPKPPSSYQPMLGYWDARPPPSSQQIPLINFWNSRPPPNPQPIPVVYSNPASQFYGDRLLGQITSSLIKRASFSD